MPKCPNCDQETPGGVRFCPSCGALVNPDAVGRMIEDARRALQQNPHDLNARYNLALAYKLAGMEEPALREFLRVAEAQPDFADVHFELAQLHLRAGRREEARAALQRVLELEPHHVQASRLLQETE